jgi:3-methyladenine DNA glycosylase AlkD
MLVTRPDLLPQIQAFTQSAHVWQRRLAIVTLIVAARADRRLLPHLCTMAEQLRTDRGPTMRKAVDWARRTAKKLEASG